MTTKLTIKDLNCGNCPNKKGGPDAHSAILCKIEIPVRHTYHSWVTKKQQEHIMGRGCASHPLALQVLAGPVIEELEKRDARNPIHGVPTSQKKEAYKEAIKLLKEGVMKP